jgi:hypothetical protein
MDKDGRWHNDDGPLTKKSVIHYLNRAIAKDEKGYYLKHKLGERWEKVYFYYEDTALLVTDLTINQNELSALLNTRERLSIKPENLFAKNDSLYLHQDGHTIKFNERSLVQLSSLLRNQDDKLILAFGDQEYEIKIH